MKLLTKDVAAMVGLKEATIRRYRIRGNFPEPDGHDFGHPWWEEETIQSWQEARWESPHYKAKGGSNVP